MGYKFIDINEQGLNNYASIQTIINGFNLDTELCGYRTLNVSGRSAFGRDVDTLKYTASKNAGSKSTKSKPGGIGVNKFFGSSAQGIEIEIQYELKAKTNELLGYFYRILLEFYTKKKPNGAGRMIQNFIIRGLYLNLNDLKKIGTVLYLLLK